MNGAQPPSGVSVQTAPTLTTLDTDVNETVGLTKFASDMQIANGLKSAAQVIAENDGDLQAVFNATSVVTVVQPVLDAASQVVGATLDVTLPTGIGLGTLWHTFKPEEDDADVMYPGTTYLYFGGVTELTVVVDVNAGKVVSWDPEKKTYTRFYNGSTLLGVEDA